MNGSNPAASDESENHDNLHALVDFPANDSPECGQLVAENDGT